MIFLRFLKMSDDDKHIVEEPDGWYFWDEADIDKYGPYKNMAQAKTMLNEYCKEVLENDLYWPSSN